MKHRIRQEGLSSFVRGECAYTVNRNCFLFKDGKCKVLQKEPCVYFNSCVLPLADKFEQYLDAASTYRIRHQNLEVLNPKNLPPQMQNTCLNHGFYRPLRGKPTHGTRSHGWKSQRQEMKGVRENAWNRLKRVVDEYREKHNLSPMRDEVQAEIERRDRSVLT